MEAETERETEPGGTSRAGKDHGDSAAIGLTSPLPSEDAVDQSTQGLCPPPEGPVDQDMVELPPPSEDPVVLNAAGPSPSPSEDAVDQDMVGLPPPSEATIVRDAAGPSPSPSEGAVDQDVVELPPPSEDTVVRGAAGRSPLPPEDAVDPQGPCMQPSESCGSEQSICPDANNNVVQPPVLGEGDKAAPSPRPEVGDDLRECAGSGGPGGLLGAQAQPSEAELIAALRRHSCWVCGAAAGSHDANISHMLTHLQTGAGAPEAGALPPLPSLLMPPHAFLMDSTASADLAANPSVDTFSPFLFGDDDCQPLPELRPFDAVPLPAVGARRPMPTLVPLRLMDDALRGLPPGGADCDVFSPRPPSSALWPRESEVPFFKQPPRFSYPGRRVTHRVVRQQQPVPVDENANVDVAGMKLRPRVAPGGKPDGSEGRGADDVEDGVEREHDEHAVGIDEHLRQLSDSLVCAVCLETFESRDALLEHVKTEVRVLGLQARRGKKAKPKTPVKSPARADGAAKAADTHVDDEAEGGRHVCKHCAKRFLRRADMRLHVAAAHPRVTPTAPVVPAKSPVKVPEADSGDERQHECGVCGKRFRRRSHLGQHCLVHSDERPFVCAHCGAAFRRKDRLVVHARTHLSAGRGRSGAAHKARVVAAAAAAAKRAAAEAGAAGGVQDNGVVAPRGSAPTEAAPGASVLTTRAKTKLLQSGAVLEAKVTALSAKAAAVAASSGTGPATETSSGRTRRFGCVTCGASYPLRSRLRRHVLACHAPLMPHVCLTCGKNCAGRALLLLHMQRHSEERVHEVRGSGGQGQEHADGAGGAGVLAEDVDMEAVEAPAAAGDTTEQQRQPPTDGGDAVAASKSSPGKSPSKHIVFKVISKQGSSDATSVAAKFLPKLAADYASSLGHKDGPKPGSKVVYMLLSKRGLKRGAEGGGGAEVPGSGDGPSGALKSASKVIFRRIPKDVPALSTNILVPKTPPKLGFKVVPRVVAADSANLEARKPTLSTVPGIVPLDPAKSVPAAPTAGVADPGPAAPDAAAVQTDAAGAQGRRGTPDGAAAPQQQGAPKDSAEDKGTPLEDKKAGVENRARTSAHVLHREPVRSSPRISSARSAKASPRMALTGGSKINPQSKVPLHPADRLRTNPLDKTPQPREGLPAPPIVPAKKNPQPQADGRFLCEKCGRRFMAEKLYRLHVQMHAGARAVKTFECQCCGHKFLDKGVLIAHLRTHL